MTFRSIPHTPISVGRFSAILQRDGDEYRVRLLEGPVPKPDADYFTDDLSDARATGWAMVRHAAKQALPPAHTGMGPVPESAGECEYGQDEYQWRLRQAGL